MKLFFHLRRSPTVLRRDEEGQEFQTLDDAYATVCREIPDLVAEFLRQRTDAMGFSFEITDEYDRLIMEIPFREMVRPEPYLDMEAAHQAFEAFEMTAHLVAKAGAGEPQPPTSYEAFLRSPIPCLFMDVQAAIHDINDAFENVSYFKRRQLAGRNFFDMFPDRLENDDFAGRRRLRESLQRIAKNPKPEAYRNQRYDIRGPGDEWVVFHWDVDNWPIFDEAGRFFGVVHFGRLAREPAERLARKIKMRMMISGA
ncbi:PAS domain-containing protein [Fulvimarina sp. MAC3]|uniref:DUF6894 family protein n=1 Tax=Fulvimarina sp. MAC3 TaxID=3148887 RepID=UPI0031FBD9CC